MAVIKYGTAVQKTKYKTKIVASPQRLAEDSRRPEFISRSGKEIFNSIGLAGMP